MTIDVTDVAGEVWEPGVAGTGKCPVFYRFSLVEHREVPTWLFQAQSFATDKLKDQGYICFCLDKGNKSAWLYICFIQC